VETLEPTTALLFQGKTRRNVQEFNKKWEKLGSNYDNTYIFSVQEMRLMDNIRFSTVNGFVKFMKENTDLLQRVLKISCLLFKLLNRKHFVGLKHLMIVKYD
jgi:hypothetical protein